MRGLAAAGRGLAAACVIGCAGCTSATVHSTSAAPAAPAPAAPAASAPGSTPALTLPSRALAAPGCSTATATSPLLDATKVMEATPGAPFGVAVTPDGRWAFVALTNSVEVLRIGSSLAPVRTGSVSVPAGPFGETLTPGGRYLLAAANGGLVVISVARAEQGRPGAVLGTLSASDDAAGAIEVAASPDGRYAFVTEEDSHEVAVFNLQRALTKGFGPADYVGAIPTGVAPVGMAVAPGGRWLYVTSEEASNTSGQQGTLSVVSLSRAETGPAKSVAATVAAGCNPVRVITSADGREVWVTARASDDLLCFSAARLATEPSRALVAITRVGTLPVGLALVRSGTLMVVADSNRFDIGGATANLDVVNVTDAAAGRPAVIGHITAGKFPREMALVPGSTTLLIGNYASGQLEAIQTASLPAAAG